jgi:hypothetical protein
MSLSNLLRRSKPPLSATDIVVVSGLPRSGTSLMMKMLEAGGIPPMNDNQRTADDDNPGGYYEFERVKQLPKGDVAWLAQAGGKAVKVIAALLPHLPPSYRYHIIFMRRDMSEILSSQRQMLIRRGMDPDQVSDQEMAELFRRHLQRVDTWLASQRNVRRLDVSYNALLSDPQPHVAGIIAFLDHGLDSGRMIEAIDPRLYRQRHADAETQPPK